MLEHEHLLYVHVQMSQCLLIQDLMNLESNGFEKSFFDFRSTVKVHTYNLSSIVSISLQYSLTRNLKLSCQQHCWSILKRVHL